MSEGFQFFDIIFLAMLAGFIALRLRSVLGRRTGHERPSGEEPDHPYGDPKAEKALKPNMDLPRQNDQVPADRGTVDYRLILSPSSPAFDGIEAIRRYDSNFELDRFVQGARAAYEMILTAFWAGDREEYKPFVSDEVFAQFDAAIRVRSAEGTMPRNRLDRVRHAEIVGATLQGALATITIRFTGDAVLTTVDSEGRIIAGDPHDPVEIKDEWTFERNLDNRDPNWVLIATHNVAA